MTDRTALIDYGMGNLHSIGKALETIGANVRITRDAAEIRAAARVVLPGVGAIGDTVAELRRLELTDVIMAAIANQPFLGICVGMQALLTRSTENHGVDCLNALAGDVRHFSEATAAAGLKIPHMGWNTVRQTQRHPIWDGIADHTRFYFVHSYFAQPQDPRLIAGATPYGIDFAAALARDNIFATQFHPEKSHDAGLKLLENFVRWRP